MQLVQGRYLDRDTLIKTKYDKRYAFIEDWNSKCFDTFNVFIQSKSLYETFH